MHPGDLRDDLPRKPMAAVKGKTERLETLIEINALINSQYRDVKVLLSRIMESAERLIGTDASSLLLLDPETQQLFFEVALGDKGEDVKNYRLEMGEGIVGWVAQNNLPLLVNDPKNDPRHSSAIANETGYRTHNLLAVPLRAKNEVIGVLEVINKSGGGNYDDDDLRFLEVLANQASIAIQNTREYDRLTMELDSLRKRVAASEVAHTPFIWKSPVSGRILEQSDRAAQSDSPILLMGESGTGKELLAERIHHSSQRHAGPLVKVNCAAIPHDLLETELFGYARGAFTDAVRDKSGYFERAEGGTLFLDEVGELSMSVQGKLLRVLQDGHYQRVGGADDSIADVRVVAATNRDLAREVDESRFRRDLYYRLAVLPVTIPPLRDRPEDIEELARHFLATLGLKHPQAPEGFRLDALEILLSHRWPGNARELQNIVERAIISGRGKALITPAELPMGGNRDDATYKGKMLKESVTLFKKNFIREVLAANNNNQTLTAQALGIQRTYLSRMMKELEIGSNTVKKNPGGTEN